MKEHLTMKDVTPSVKSAVRAYLLARTYAEMMREKVNAVYRESLETYPLYTDIEIANGVRLAPLERIYDVDKMYLSADEKTCKDVYADANMRLRTAGLKPDSMSDDHCPALVAEGLQRDAELLIISAGVEMMKLDIDEKEFHHRLLCEGLEAYHKFIDLMVGLVVNLPDFKNPLTA